MVDGMMTSQQAAEFRMNCLRLAASQHSGSHEVYGDATPDPTPLKQIAQETLAVAWLDSAHVLWEQGNAKASSDYAPTGTDKRRGTKVDYPRRRKTDEEDI